MVCPRCGTLGTDKAQSCARCGGSLGRPQVALPDPPIPRAPTHRGELAQRAKGIEPQVLAKAKSRPAPPAPEVVRYSAPAGTVPAAPAVPAGSAWPPPPATWEPVPAPAGGGPAPTPAWTPPDPNWAPPQAWNPPPQPPAPNPPTAWAPSSNPAAWRPDPDKTRQLPRWNLAFGRSASAEAPSYFWQALICLILFPPTGVAAVIYSLMVTKRLQDGDTTAARRASYLTRVLCLWSLVGVAAALVILAVTGIKP